MVLANIFYVMAIIVMSLMLILLIALVVAVFYIKNKIDKIHREIVERIDSVVRPAESMMDLGSTIAATASNAFKKFTQKDHHKNK